MFGVFQIKKGGANRSSLIQRAEDETEHGRVMSQVRIQIKKTKNLKVFLFCSVKVVCAMIQWPEDETRRSCVMSQVCISEYMTHSQHQLAIHTNLKKRIKIDSFFSISSTFTLQLQIHAVGAIYLTWKKNQFQWMQCTLQVHHLHLQVHHLH